MGRFQIDKGNMSKDCEDDHYARSFLAQLALCISVDGASS